MSQNISSVYKSRFVIGIISAIVLFVATNILFDYFMTNARLDLTENKLYTLSEGMRKTIEKIDEPITLRLYFSDKLQRVVPSFGVYGSRVKDFLTEIADLSKGKIKLRILDPEPFSEIEDEAVGLGLQGVPIDNAGTKVYFGLVGTNAVDTKELVPFFQPDKEKFLEYDLAKMIGNLANPKRKVIGVLSGFSLDQPDPSGQTPWMIINQIRQTFITRALFNPLTEIEDDVDILMLIHPGDLPDTTLYAIDQYLLRGGKMIAFVDPHSDYNAGQANSNNPYGPPQDAPRLTSDMHKIFTHWGIELEPQKIVGDLNLAQKVNVGQRGEMNVVQYLPWLRLGKDNMNQEDLVTSDLKVVNVASAGHIKKLESSKLEFTPLMTSSKEAGLIDTKELRGAPDPEKMLQEFQPSGEIYNFAVRLHGNVTTLFPEGKPVSADASKESASKPGAPISEKPQLKEGVLNAIIVADTDLLENRFWVQVQNFFGQPMMMAQANNADFVVNALDNLSGSSDLISLRSRGLSARPFTLVQKLQDEAESNYKARAEALRAKLKEAERRIADLQNADSDGKILSSEQQETIETFRQDAVKVRRELRQVQLALRQDIRSLEKWVEFFNIGFIPIFVFLIAIFFGILRYRRLNAKTA